MAPRLPPGRVLAIEEAISDTSFKPSELPMIAITYGTTYSSVRRIYNRMIRIKTLGVDLRKKAGPRRILTPEIDLAVAHLLAEKPYLSQDEIVDFLYNEFSVKISQSAVSKQLKRIEFTRKKQ